ncbi:MULTISPECIES: type IV secretion system protein VirB10 [Agrobacterium]|uniref:Type IV secretion system protein VirB10 n=1 Tax=Agrobacterium larrymoorei TaxID=160699 RepID=A0ABX8TC81_9HYPH|nr:type IV secretion system protein VirB10 [Agrobacterium larrymoorei]NSZ10060.1 TrbI/VirB10 family protein [Agrobacterium tumefaciens]QYA10862.1 type IV secretion system protein VirB10 [Agrobacterium larrymoorei]
MSNTDNQNQNEEAEVSGERGAGITSVAEEKSAANTLGKSAVVGVIALAGLGFLYMTWDSGNKKPAEPEQTRTQIGPGAVPFTPAALPPPPPQEPTPVQQPIPVQPVIEPEEKNEMLEASIRSPVIAFSNSGGQNRRNGQEGGEQGGNGQGNFSLDLPQGLAGLGGLGGEQAAQQRQDRLRDKMQPTVLDGVKASVIPDLHMVVPQGTQIPCVLQTAISSDQPGMVSCVIQRDVLSASGQVVLMEKGTIVVGEYNDGLRRGAKRIFVLWNRARTPTGVVVNMASPGADGLGRSGFDGKIDNHFWDRFGGAILMSVVGDASKYAFSRLNENSEFETSETENATKDASAIALENSINIPPTLYKNQGEQVSIFVARDLDFGDVYQLKATETRNQIFDRTVTGDMRKHAPTGWK